MRRAAPNPAPSYDAAVAQIRAIQQRDDDQIDERSRTRLWAHGRRTPRALLYLQGYTDSTQQFEALGQQLFERGLNVLAPRLIHHGYKDRTSRAHAALTPAETVEWASQAVDVALGLGEQLTVMGLSLGGVLATWVAQYREEVARVLILAPAYGTRLIPARITRPAARAVVRLPNLFIWWDPRVRENTGIEYAYPRFATHSLARVFLFSGELLDAARRRPPAVHSVWMVTNANDHAVNNSICAAFVAAWRSHKTHQVRTYEFPRALGLPHDLLDPIDPLVKPEVVYPRLLEIIEQP